ncbi:MAG TPA: FtsX-like permease family protein, partial [Candidatus Polarisedimenticolia bacterium]|nr:FtsX-like permease family protein [Candidatus Polarisedimenticolia bacterium]
QGAADRRENPWTLLEEPIEPGVIPAIGDANSVQWILHSGLGQDLELTDESGRQVRLRFVALLSSSPFQSEVILSEADFMRHFGGRGGYGAFLIEAPPGSSDAVARALEGALGHAGFDATSTMERIAAFHRVENTYLSTFQVLGGLGLLLGTLGLGVVVLRNILERRFELAALRAIGFARRRLARMLLMENLMLFSAGLLAGAGAGMAAVAPRLAAGAVAPDWPQLAATLAGVAAAGALSTGAAAAGALRAPLIPALKQDR